MPPLRAFSLSDLHGTVRRFPTARLHLLCILKADCPTCVLSAPLLEAAFEIDTVRTVTAVPPHVASAAVGTLAGRNRCR